jgi:hypothetical protein
MATSYRAPNGDSTIGRIQLFVTVTGTVTKTWTVNELTPTGNVLATFTHQPSATECATVLRRRGEPTTIFFDMTRQSNDGHYRAAGAGMVQDGSSYLSGANPA